MVKFSSFKLHKFAGLSAGIVLFILAVSGFVLDHDYWRVLYSVRFPSDSQEMLQKEQRLITSKTVLQEHIYVGSMRGIYETLDDHNEYVQTLNLPTMALFAHENDIYAATTDGIYLRHFGGRWQPFSLKGEIVTTLSGNKEKLVAVVDKKELVVLSYDAQILQRSGVMIPKEQLEQSITLSRFLRDLHYGRGIFDHGLSLLLNDYAALTLAFLALSGYIIWFLILKKRAVKLTRLLIKLHANVFVLTASFSFVILGISGIFVDHSSFFGKYTKNISVPHSILPPVYSTLKEDIWSVALKDDRYYIGNRVGVYASEDLQSWKLFSKGFGYSLSKVDEKLYIGGMGAPNRVCDIKECRVLPDTPHMFKQAYKKEGKVHYLSSHTKNTSLPHFKDVSLYTLMFTMHDGSFFASWWIWVNDLAVVLLFILIVTGSYRWWKKRIAKVRKE